MNCAACNALSGAQQAGGYNGMRPQAGMASLENYLSQFGGVTLDHPDIVLVQILLYDFQLDTTEVTEAQAWASHFGFDRNPNVHVLVPKDDLRGKASFKSIPGVYLLDRQLVVRKDSTGHKPRHNLWRELLPAVPALLRS